MLFSTINVLYFDISTSRSTCFVPSTALLSSSLRPVQMFSEVVFFNYYYYYYYYVFMFVVNYFLYFSLCSCAVPVTDLLEVVSTHS